MSISSMASAIKAKETAIGERVKSSKAANVYWPAVKGIGNKIPLGKNVIIILGVAIFAVCLTLLITAYVTQVNEYDEVSDELASVEGQTATINAEELSLLQSIADSDYEVTELDNQLAAKWEQLTYPLVVSSIFEELLDVADANEVVITDGVDVTTLRSAVQGTEEIAGQTYKALNIQMTVAGTDSNIYQFVEDLDKDFPTGVMTALHVDIYNDDGEVDPRALILLSIYSL